MFVGTVSKRRLISRIYTLALLGIGALLLYRPQAAATGISRGLSICTGVIIPTLYPFMILAGLLADSPLCRRPGRLAEWIAVHLFGLPGCCATAVLLAMVGGYPAGALAIGRLKQQGLINHEQASRLTAFGVCGGPGFIVGTVGAGLLNSVQAGLLLYAAQVFACLAIGIWLGRGHRCPSTPVGTSALPPRRSLAKVVSDTCGALLSMCGFVVLAATVLSMLDALEIPRQLAAFTGMDTHHWAAAFAAIGEVSCGCIALAKSTPLAPFLLSLTMGWAGLSVQGQLAAALPGMRVLSLRFWGWRLLQGTLAGVVATLLFSLFPRALDTVAGGEQLVPYQVSTAASVMLLILSFLAMLQFSAKKTGNMSQDVVR